MWAWLYLESFHWEYRWRYTLKHTYLNMNIRNQQLLCMCYLYVFIGIWVSSTRQLIIPVPSCLNPLWCWFSFFPPLFPLDLRSRHQPFSLPASFTEIELNRQMNAKCLPPNLFLSGLGGGNLSCNHSNPTGHWGNMAVRGKASCDAIWCFTHTCC